MTRGTKTVAWALARATYARLHPNNTAFFNRRKSGSHPQPTFVPRVRNARATFCPRRHSCPAWTKTVAWASARATDLPLHPKNTADHSVRNTPGLCVQPRLKLPQPRFSWINAKSSARRQIALPGCSPSSARQCIPRSARTSLHSNGGRLRLLNTDVRLGRSVALPRGPSGSAGASPSQGGVRLGMRP